MTTAYPPSSETLGIIHRYMGSEMSIKATSSVRIITLDDGSMVMISLNELLLDEGDLQSYPNLLVISPRTKSDCNLGELERVIAEKFRSNELEYIYVGKMVDECALKLVYHLATNRHYYTKISEIKRELAIEIEKGIDPDWSYVKKLITIK